MVEIRQRSRHVFEKNGDGLARSDDSLDIGPEVAGIVGPSPLASDGEGLAREASVDKIDSASPRASVERAEVGPDRGTIQQSVLSTPNEHVLAERVRFAVGDGTIVGDDALESTFDASNPATQGKGVHSNIHATPFSTAASRKWARIASQAARVSAEGLPLSYLSEERRRSSMSRNVAIRSRPCNAARKRSSSSGDVNSRIMFIRSRLGWPVGLEPTLPEPQSGVLSIWTTATSLF